MPLDEPDYDPQEDLRPDGADVLDAARSLIKDYCALPSEEAYDAVVLWCAATHALPSLPAAPRLVAHSAVKRSGKTRLMDLIEGLVHDPLPTMNATTAAVFRSLDAEHPPTLMIDEVDTIFGSKKVAENNEDLRGLINAGFQRGKDALRCVGPQQVPTKFPTFAMVALAGIGGLPDTIMDRSVVIRMKRRRPDEIVKPFRLRRDSPRLEKVQQQLSGWLGDPRVLKKLQDAEPENMGLEDRAADTWEPLLMVADHAGGDWPVRARAAGKKLTEDAAEDEAEDSNSIRVLHDIREAFEFIQGDFVPTDILLQNLMSITDSPWREMGLNGHQLGHLLRSFGIRSGRDSTGSKRGYKRTAFTDAWQRYPVTEGNNDD